MVWFIVETAIALLGTYNVIKSFYTVYNDAKTVKNNYVEQEKITREYKRVQRNECLDPLTESQYHKYSDEFVLI